jgi:hypothetical protein
VVGGGTRKQRGARFVNKESGGGGGTGENVSLEAWDGGVTWPTDGGAVSRFACFSHDWRRRPEQRGKCNCAPLAFYGSIQSPNPPPPQPSAQVLSCWLSLTHCATICINKKCVCAQAARGKPKLICDLHLIAAGMSI